MGGSREEEEEEGVCSDGGGGVSVAPLISPFIDFKEHHQVAQSGDNSAHSSAVLGGISHVECGLGRSSASWEQEA